MTDQTLPQKRAAIYARRATQPEASQGFTTSTQILQCLEYAQRQGYQVADGNIYEEVWSGATLDRPLLTRLREAAQLRLFDVVIVSDLQRISRRLDQTLEVIQELDALGIAVESMQEQHSAAGWKLREESIITTKGMSQSREHVAIYARTYPRNEAREQQATESRIQQCLQCAREQGYTVFEQHIYQDVAVGTTFERRGLEPLREAMKQGEFAALFVTDLTQLSRNPENLSVLLEEAKESRIKIISLSEPPVSYKWNADYTALEPYELEAGQIVFLFEEYGKEQRSNET